MYNLCNYYLPCYRLLLLTCFSLSVCKVWLIAGAASALFHAFPADGKSCAETKNHFRLVIDWWVGQGQQWVKPSGGLRGIQACTSHIISSAQHLLCHLCETELSQLVERRVRKGWMLRLYIQTVSPLFFPRHFPPLFPLVLIPKCPPIHL